MHAQPMTAARIISFGYLWGHPPHGAHITVDVRGWIPGDPHTAAWCRPLTGADPRVRGAVLTAPGVRALIAALSATVSARHTADPTAVPTVAVGCSGGRHRSVAVADQFAAVLRATGVQVAVVHRDAHHLWDSTLTPPTEPGGSLGAAGYAPTSVGG